MQLITNEQCSKESSTKAYRDFSKIKKKMKKKIKKRKKNNLKE